MKVINYIDELKEGIKERPQCLMVFLLLRLNFKDAEPFYNNDHVITRIDDKFYDWTGEVSVLDHIPFETHYGANWAISHYESIIPKNK